MRALITVRSASGKVVKFCGKNCYNAKKEACDCVCGGRLHGKGQEDAVRLLREEFGEIAREWELAHPDAGEVEIEMGGAQ